MKSFVKKSLVLLLIGITILGLIFAFPLNTVKAEESTSSVQKIKDLSLLNIRLKDSSGAYIVNDMPMCEFTGEYSSDPDEVSEIKIFYDLSNVELGSAGINLSLRIFTRAISSFDSYVYFCMDNLKITAIDGTVYTFNFEKCSPSKGATSTRLLYVDNTIRASSTSGGAILFTLPLKPYHNEELIQPPLSGTISFNVVTYVNRGEVYGSNVKEEEVPEKEFGDYISDVNDFYTNDNLTPTTKFLRVAFSTVAVVGLGFGVYFLVAYLCKKKKK